MVNGRGGIDSGPCAVMGVVLDAVLGPGDMRAGPFMRVPAVALAGGAA